MVRGEKVLQLNYIVCVEDRQADGSWQMLPGPGWGQSASFHAVMALKWGKWSRVNKRSIVHFPFLTSL